MPTIASENAKPIRQAMTVICGMDVPNDSIPSATAVSSYDSYSGNVTGVPVFSQLMDLSGNGFANDGLARPLEADHAGIVANVNAAGNSSTLEVTITLSQSVAAETTLKFYYYEGNGEMKTQTLTASGTTASVTLSSNIGRLHLVKVSVGDSWWFNNDSLFSCHVDLRSVETKVDNPELQISSLEIVGYEPNDVLNKIARIGQDSPIYYTCGYPGDMSPVRKFYLSEPIKWADKQITFKAEDATRFLTEDYIGKAVGTIRDGDQYGGIGRYITEIHNMLNDAGIEHEYSNEYTTGTLASGMLFLMENKPKRFHIAQAVNLLKCKDDALQCTVSYVDAGMPRLWTGRDETQYTIIDDVAEVKIETDQSIKRVEMNVSEWYLDPSSNIETLELAGAKFMEFSEPYYSFATTRGTITKLSPYKIKISGSGSATVSGRKLTSYDGDEMQNTPSVATTTTGVRIVKLEDFTGPISAYTGGGYWILDWYYLAQLIRRGKKIYTFKWRGDPRLQPRDYLKVKINGVYENMTIDSITLEHTDGGLVSEIVARGGWI